MTEAPEDQPKSEVWVTCSDCRHRWIGLYLPMPISDAARVMKRLTCPKCACAKILCATAEVPPPGVRLTQWRQVADLLKQGWRVDGFYIVSPSGERRSAWGNAIKACRDRGLVPQ